MCIVSAGISHSRITPVAPLSAITIEMMKNPKATMPRDSLHVKPIAIMPAANCHVAALCEDEAVSFGAPFEAAFEAMSGSLECVRDPVCDEANGSPFASVFRYWVQILVRPV